MSEPPSQFSNTSQSGGVNMQGATITDARDIIGTYNDQRQVFTPRPAPTEAEIADAQERFARLASTIAAAIPELAPLPSGSLVTITPNAVFVGRGDELRSVASALIGGGAAITAGMGGVGKTQLAVEVAHRYGQFFAGGVFWLSFADAAQVATQIAACGGPAALALYDDRAGLNLDDQVAMVLRVWKESLPRLLIFDNCEEEALLREWRSKIIGGRCHILVTSRRPT